MTSNATGGLPSVVMQRLRKLSYHGNTHTVTIPSKWVQKFCDPKLPYVTTTLLADNSILLRPFNPKDPTGEECQIQAT